MPLCVTRPSFAGTGRVKGKCSSRESTTCSPDSNSKTHGRAAMPRSAFCCRAHQNGTVSDVMLVARELGVSSSNNPCNHSVRGQGSKANHRRKVQHPRLRVAHCKSSNQEKRTLRGTGVRSVTRAFDHATGMHRFACHHLGITRQQLQLLDLAEYAQIQYCASGVAL